MRSRTHRTGVLLCFTGCIFLMTLAGASGGREPPVTSNDEALAEPVAPEFSAAAIMPRPRQPAAAIMPWPNNTAAASGPLQKINSVVALPEEPGGSRPPLALAIMQRPKQPAAAETPKGEPESGSQLYDASSGHLWNRLHRALLVRTGPDGKVYGEDRIEPLLWGNSLYLLKGPQSDQVHLLLDEFLDQPRAKLIKSPIKRAILQRDLWLVANWFSGEEELDPRGQKLFEKLVRAIKLLALSTQEIERLPDNYQQTVESGDFAPAFDPQSPKQAYLPRGLFDPDGPWICVGRTDGPTAPSHLELTTGQSFHNGNRFTNSVFLVFMKLPGGRKAGVRFLEELRKTEKPIFDPNYDEATGMTGPTRLNRDLPQLPKGTELALLRKALLINDEGKLVVSPITESVQIRVHVQPPKELPEKPESLRIEDRDPQSHLAVFEYQLRRAGLFQGTKGLVDVSEEIDFFKTGFGFLGLDIFEKDTNPLNPPYTFEERKSKITSRQSCLICHNSATIYGTISFQRKWYFDEPMVQPMYPVEAMTPQEVARRTLQWKREQTDWKRLHDQR